MDSASSDSTPKLDTSSNNSSLPRTTGPAGVANAEYYQPPSGQAVSEPSAVSPTGSSVPPVSSVPPSGVVPPAPGSPTLGSMPPASAPGGPPVVSFESPTRPNVPSMGMNSVSGSMPAAAAVPPTVSNEATAHQVQERMQTANAAAGGKAGKKRSLLLPVLGIIVVLAIAAAAAFWWWSNQSQDFTPVNSNESLTQNEMPETPSNSSDVIEGIVPRDESLLATAAESEVTNDTPNTGEVFGLICEYENTHPAGAVLFYEPETQGIHRLQLAEGKNVYSMKVPAGQYMAFFEPADAELPIFAFSEYVNCGLDPNSCTDHSMALFTVEAGKEYGQVDLCDPQYVQNGLPTELQYENS